MQALPSDPMVLMVMVACIPLGVLVLSRSPTISATIALLAFVQTGTKWGSIATGAIDPRPLAAVCLLMMLASLVGRRATVPHQTRGGLLFACLALTALSFASITWSQDPSKTTFAAIAWLVLLGLMSITPAAIGQDRLLHILRWILLVLILTSAAMVAVRAPGAWYAGRAMGLFRNPNGLGVYCVLAAPFFAISPRWRIRALWLIPFVLCVATGSRAATAGLFAGTAIMVWRKASASMKFLVVPLLAPAAYFAYGAVRNASSSNESGLVLLRDTNSRDLVWAEALARIQEHPWLGLGLGALETESGSSFLKVTAELGVVGLIVGCIVVVGMLSVGRRSVLASGVVVGALIDAAFEGWLFTAGSVYAVVLFMILIAIPDDQPQQQEPVAESDAAATQPDSRGQVALGRSA